jgi:YbgC/YbaW family acyl-CoA thioester hydrolase
VVREYKWRLRVRSYEGDAWGLVPASGILRYLEQSAIDAADDAGYGPEFHRETRSAWVIRRMTLLFDEEPARTRDDLEIRTWISHFAKVRGGREYRIANASTSNMVATGLAEWVYLNRDTFAPLQIPADLGTRLDLPGAPLGTYEAPKVLALANGPSFTTEREARWHEADSMQHINNAIYADWLDEAMREAVTQMGWSVGALKRQGLQLRGEYYYLDYKKAAVPGDLVIITTRIAGISPTHCAVDQSIVTPDRVELLRANNVYRWRTGSGEGTEGPEGWVARFER